LECYADRAKKKGLFGLQCFYGHLIEGCVWGNGLYYEGAKRCV